MSLFHRIGRSSKFGNGALKQRPLWIVWIAVVTSDSKSECVPRTQKRGGRLPRRPLFRIDPTERDLPDALGEQALRKPHRLNFRRPEIMFVGRPATLIAFENREEVHLWLSSLKYMVKIALRNDKPPSGTSLAPLYILVIGNVALQKSNGCHRIGTYHADPCRALPDCRGNPVRIVGDDRFDPP